MSEAKHAAKKPLFQKILIANRGEIACRVATTAKRLGIQTVAVHSDVDRQALHVRLCDEAVSLGGDSPQTSYLRWQAIIDAALALGVEAIHPGYGFLSENEDFALACAESGLVFIGPPASAIRAMGLKAESKRLMEQAGVRLVPGYHGERQDAVFLQEQANQIGYPVLIKASAGGGGKGMRVVERDEDFMSLLESCQREAQKSFANAHVLLEKYVQRPRHIEIQVFADSHGNYVHLYERDCSVQRRHQKVLEEAPAPHISEALRAQMGAAAIAAAKSVGYVGAGTVEFIVEQADHGEPRFYFMEMNTRLQVEHPVTEAITGLDLVEWQLRVAAGETLPLTQAEVPRRGHAIEARICAENPEKDFLPATGPLKVLRWPAHSSFTRNQLATTEAEEAKAGVRIDAGFVEGDRISPFYDSMLAKLIVHAPTREQALEALDKALAQTHIVGLANNVQFLRHVVQSASFSQGEVDTALIPRESKHLFQQQSIAPEAALTQVAAYYWAEQKRDAQKHSTGPMRGHLGADSWQDPWSRLGGYGAFLPQLKMQVYGVEQTISPSVRTLDDDASRFPNDASLSLDDANLNLNDASIYQDGRDYFLFTGQGSAVVQIADPYAASGDAQAQLGQLTAPMPGKLIGLKVQVGEAVKAGQVLAVMEAMKMEHSISAPSDGVVAQLFFQVGDQIGDAQAILKLEALA